MFLQLRRRFLHECCSLHGLIQLTAKYIRSYSRTTCCHSDSLLMYSASEPALFNFGCMIRLSSAICLPLYVGRYSASSFRSASRPSRLGVSMIKRNGLFLMKPTMTAYSMRYFFPSSSGGRSLSKYGVVLLATSSATSPKRGSTAGRCAASWNRHSS